MNICHFPVDSTLVQVQMWGAVLYLLCSIQSGGPPGTQHSPPPEGLGVGLSYTQRRAKCSSANEMLCLLWAAFP